MPIETVKGGDVFEATVVGHDFKRLLMVVESESHFGVIFIGDDEEIKGFAWYARSGQWHKERIVQLLNERNAKFMCNLDGNVLAKHIRETCGKDT